jgi:glycosyltransferase involved in cell wall biosynthesis
MQILMLSLDKKILDKDSRVAKRMVRYGKEDELFIVIPNKDNKHFDLSPTVHVRSTGGNKIQQFFRLKKFGMLAINRGGAEFITTQDPFFLGLVGWWIKSKSGKDLVVQLHGDFFGNNYYKHSGFRNLVQYYIGKFVISKADRIRVVGMRVKQSILDMGIKADKIIVKPVVELDANSNLEVKTNLKNKYSDFKKIFLVLGRIEPVKNISWLIKLWDEISKDYLLLIVGDGSLRKILESSVGKVENIIFENWTMDNIGYIKSADCVLFPSRSEGYGLVPMEALEAGTRIIMNDVGVANFELQPSDTVKIISLKEKEAWVREIHNS